MKRSIILSGRYCGPPVCINGGYACGILSGNSTDPVEITLKKPVPMEKPLWLEHQKEKITLNDGMTELASARFVDFQLEVPAPPTHEIARVASAGYLGLHQEHPFPHCFVCGPARAPDDGLHLYAGRIPDTNLYVTPWQPNHNLPVTGNHINREIVWAALDCPGAFSVMGEQPKMLVLGQMTGQVRQSIRPGESCLVIAWSLGSDGRKHYCGTAIYNEDNYLCALARSVWFEVTDMRWKGS